MTGNWHTESYVWNSGLFFWAAFGDLCFDWLCCDCAGASEGCHSVKRLPVEAGEGVKQGSEDRQE